MATPIRNEWDKHRFDVKALVVDGTDVTDSTTAFAGVTATAAELNKLAGVTAGATTASKALVVGANQNLDVLAIADGGLKLGAGAGTAVSALAAELNLTDGQVANVTFTPASAGSNVCEVTIAFKDAAAALLARVHKFAWWLSDAATGEGLTGTDASGTVAAKAASGTDLSVMTAKKATNSLSLATGNYILEITDTAKTGFYVCVEMPNGVVKVSAVLVSGDYGA